MSPVTTYYKVVWMQASYIYKSLVTAGLRLQEYIAVGSIAARSRLQTFVDADSVAMYLPSAPTILVILSYFTCY